MTAASSAIAREIAFFNSGDRMPQLGSDIRIDAGEATMQNCVAKTTNVWCVSPKNSGLCALNEDGSVNAIGNAAERGKLIVLYGTGAGTFKSSPIDGAVIGLPLPEFLAPLSLQIGAVDAQLLYEDPGIHRARRPRCHSCTQRIDGFPAGYNDCGEIEVWKTNRLTHLSDAAMSLILASFRDPGALPRVSVCSRLDLGLALTPYIASSCYWAFLVLMAIVGGTLNRLNAAMQSTLQMAAVFALIVSPLVGGDAAFLLKVNLYLKEASELTGFAVDRKVPAAMMSSAELERYLKSKMKTEVDSNKVDTEELVLKMFGFAPPDFKLKETTLELLQEQAAAFYDFKAKKLYVLDHVQEGLGPELLIHELGHALADQRYGLSKFLKGAKGDDDAALARMAVMEGQAMWLMGEHAARESGLSLKTSPELVQRLSRSNESNDDSFPVMKRVPLYLKESLMFPYSYGFRFQAAVCEKDSDCMKRVFEKPPASSAQVMHPELYFAGVLPEKVSAPLPPKGSRWRSRADGTLGEVDMDLLLRTFGKKSAGLVERFRGGSYRMYENRKSHHILLSHASVWKDEESAQEWLDVYGSLLASKWKKFEVKQRGPHSLEGLGDHGGFRLRREGRSVIAEEGLPVH